MFLLYLRWYIDNGTRLIDCLLYRFIKQMVPVIFNWNQNQRVPSFSRNFSKSPFMRTVQQGPGEAVSIFETPATDNAISDTKQKALEAEKTVFDYVTSAAELYAKENSDWVFFVFHGLRYGLAAEGTNKDWQSDIDVVLLGLQKSTGAFWACISSRTSYVFDVIARSLTKSFNFLSLGMPALFLFEVKSSDDEKNIYGGNPKKTSQFRNSQSHKAAAQLVTHLRTLNKELQLNLHWVENQQWSNLDASWVKLCMCFPNYNNTQYRTPLTRTVGGRDQVELNPL